MNREEQPEHPVLDERFDEELIPAKDSAAGVDIARRPPGREHPYEAWRRAARELFSRRDEQ